MCVGLSARVVRINENGTALVDASGAKRQVSVRINSPKHSQVRTKRKETLENFA